MLDSANSPPYSLINLNTTHVPIAQDMEFDEDKSHLYVLAGNQVGLQKPGKISIKLFKRSVRNLKNILKAHLQF